MVQNNDLPKMSTSQCLEPENMLDYMAKKVVDGMKAANQRTYRESILGYPDAPNEVGRVLKCGRGKQSQRQ